MDSVFISRSDKVLDGLRLMMAAADDAEAFVQSHVEVPVALLIIEAAKLAEDRDEWFPHGKWATIQSIQCVVEKQLQGLFSGARNG